MKCFKAIWILATLLLQWSPALADDVITNIMSPIVSYQYPNDFSGEALINGGISGPIISYQYFEWPGDSILGLQSSPMVSYFYLSWGTPPNTLSSSSVVTVSPSSVPADGQSPVTITVRLLDGNGNAVSGKTVRLSVLLQGSSGAAATLFTVTQPASATDGNGQTAAAITSTIAGTAIISVQDVTDSISLVSQPRVQFTSASLPPGQPLSDAIVNLVSEASNDLNPYLPNLALNEGQCGDYFQQQASIDGAEQGAIALNAGLGGLLALVPLDEVLRPTASVLAKALLRGGISVIEDYNAVGIQGIVQDIAGCSSGLSLEGQDIGSYSGTQQQLLLQAKQNLLAGVPPPSLNLSTDYIIDLGLRQQADHTIKLLAINQDSLLSAMRSDSEFSHTDFLWPLFSTVDIIGAIIGDIYGGPLGGTLVGEALNAGESSITWSQNRANLNKDQQAYLTAVSSLMSCLHFSDMIYWNTASGLNAVAQGQRPNPVIGNIVSITSQLTGPQYDLNGAWIGADPLTTPAAVGNKVTSGKSVVAIRNTSQQSATFAVYALYQHTVQLNVLGLNVASSPHPLMIMGTRTLSTGETATISLN